MSKDRRVLISGYACIDIISTCDHYPVEDSDQRCDQKWELGGNGANSSRVLGLLGAEVECLCTMADNYQVNFIKDALSGSGVYIDHCVYHNNRQTPISVIIVNSHNGSRTILQTNKDLPEVSFDDFRLIDLSSNNYKWMHFEARSNVEDITRMLSRIDDYNQQLSTGSERRIYTSVEIEKAEQNICKLTNKADYIFVSKEHSQMRGFHNKEDAVEAIAKECRQGGSVICAWGETGAIAKTKDGASVTSPIYPPIKVIDTLGAGDTFNGATVYSLSNGHSLEDSIKFGCLVAGAKCGMQGLNGVGELQHDFIKRK